MKRLIVLSLLGLAATAGGAAEPVPAVPLRDGTYTFEHRYAEDPQLPSFTVRVRLKRGHLTVTNPHRGQAFAVGVIDRGVLRWHARSGQWIVSHSVRELDSDEVGGCSAGPSVIDLQARIYWTC